ncbi:MAG TPA: rod shape-determining protein MreC [Solirubrobacterales bacterium]|nr:rod shape-determining protein MreC [Solirubrobacterales bacterium]
MYRKQVRRRRAVLTLLILGSFLLLTITYGQTSGGLQRGVSTIFSPLQSVSDRALKPARDLIDWFDKTFDARGENSDLKTELANARRKAVAGQEALQENAQLRKLVGLDRDPPLAESAYKPVIGRVIGRSPTVWSSTVNIDVGSGDGVKVDDPVISGDGLVGTVASTQGGYSQVTLITDHTSAVSAKILPGGVQGVVTPEVGNPEDLILDFIESTKQVHGGQSVVTSGWRAQGLASLFPPGLPIGEVTNASIVTQVARQQVHLKPYADIANLDLVQVLTGGSRG